MCVSVCLASPGLALPCGGWGGWLAGWGCFRKEGSLPPVATNLQAPGFGLPLQGDISARGGELATGSRSQFSASLPSGLVMASLLLGAIRGEGQLAARLRASGDQSLVSRPWRVFDHAG